MPKNVINRGSTANDGTGDNLRAGANKINLNFDEIYTAIGDGTNINGTIKIADDSSTLVTLSANGETLRLLGGTGITSTISGNALGNNVTKPDYNTSEIIKSINDPIFNEGGLAVLNLDGIYCRYENTEEIFQDISKAKEEKATELMQKIYSEPVKNSLIEKRILQIKDSGSKCAVSIIPANTKKTLKIIYGVRI